MEAHFRAPSLPPYVGVDEVAAQLGRSRRWVHERTRLREIPHRRLPGSRSCLFLPEEIRSWVDGARLEVIELGAGGRVVRPTGEK